MTKIDELKRALEECIMLQEAPDAQSCENCSYRPDGYGTCESIAPLLRDALGVISQYAPRVLSVADAETLRNLPLEEEMMMCTEWRLDRSIMWVYARNIRPELVEEGVYRVWTAYPEKDLREATPWLLG